MSAFVSSQPLGHVRQVSKGLSRFIENNSKMNTDEIKLLTVVEFASAVGMSDRQIRRYVNQGRVRSVAGPEGITRIPESEVKRFQTKRMENEESRTCPPPSDTSDRTCPSVPRDTSDIDGPPSDMSAGHVSEVVRAHQETAIPMEIHLQTLKLLRLERKERRALTQESRRLERQVLSGQLQLVNYQRALSENAESLAEREARARQAEELANNNAAELERYEGEKAELVERLRQMETQVDWFKKRIPKWVRAMFGT